MFQAVVETSEIMREKGGLFIGMVSLVLRNLNKPLLRLGRSQSWFPYVANKVEFPHAQLFVDTAHRLPPELASIAASGAIGTHRSMVFVDSMNGGEG